MGCFGTYFAHAQTFDNVCGQSATSTHWTASVHTLHMPKPVILFVFKVVRTGLAATPCSHLVQQFKWKNSKKENPAQKVLKSEMLGMLAF